MPAYRMRKRAGQGNRESSRQGNNRQTVTGNDRGKRLRKPWAVSPGGAQPDERTGLGERLLGIRGAVSLDVGSGSQVRFQLQGLKRE